VDSSLSALAVRVDPTVEPGHARTREAHPLPHLPALRGNVWLEARNPEWPRRADPCESSPEMRRHPRSPKPWHPTRLLLQSTSLKPRSRDRTGHKMIRDCVRHFTGGKAPPVAFRFMAPSHPLPTRSHYLRPASPPRLPAPRPTNARRSPLPIRSVHHARRSA
jgi:hypothetical protein